MPTEEKKNHFKVVRSMFLSGQVSRMRDIEDVNPTNVAKSLGINHSRYIDKLRYPDKFTIKQIWKFAEILDLDVQVLIEVLKKDMSRLSKASKKKS